MKKHSMKLFTLAAICAALVFSLCGCGKIDLNFGSDDKNTIIGSGTASTSVENLNIEWVAGDVTILYDDVDEIQFEESAKEELEDDAKMRYKEEKGTLYISFCKSKKIKSVPSKNLTVVLPKEYAFNNVEFDVVSSDINLPDGFLANSLKLACVSGNIESAGEVYISDVEIQGVSGDAELCINDLKNFKAEEVSGNVQLILPKDTDFTAKIDTASGDFSTDFDVHVDGDTYMYGFGEGANIKVESVSGDFEIKMKK